MRHVKESMKRWQFNFITIDPLVLIMFHNIICNPPLGDSNSIQDTYCRTTNLCAFVGSHLIRLVKHNHLYRAFEQVHPNVKQWEETFFSSRLYDYWPELSSVCDLLATLAILTDVNWCGTGTTMLAFRNKQNSIGRRSEMLKGYVIISATVKKDQRPFQACGFSGIKSNRKPLYVNFILSLVCRHFLWRLNR